MTDAHVGIIGGGLAGLAAARAIRAAGLTAVVFDKGRGPGGRASTRRTGFGSFDHGAQYFTARSPRFTAALMEWADSGHAAVWEGRFGSLDAEGWHAAPSTPRWVGVPGMNAVVRAMAEGLDVRYGQRVAGMERHSDRWLLRGETGERLGSFESLVVAVPAPQAVELLGQPAPRLAAIAGTARLNPCWTLMAGFQDRIAAHYDAARVKNVGPLGWIARDSSKPGRATDGVDRWVIQANADWSALALEHDADRVVHEILEAFSGTFVGQLPDLVGVQAHRWRYAAVASAVGDPCLHDAGLHVSVCGDWLIEARMEAAYLSGLAAGEATVRQF